MHTCLLTHQVWSSCRQLWHPISRQARCQLPHPNPETILWILHRWLDMKTILWRHNWLELCPMPSLHLHASYIKNTSLLSVCCKCEKTNHINAKARNMDSRLNSLRLMTHPRFLAMATSQWQWLLEHCSFMQGGVCNNPHATERSSQTKTM